MELNIGSRFKNAWNAFQNKTPTSANNGYGPTCTIFITFRK